MMRTDLGTRILAITLALLLWSYVRVTNQEPQRQLPGVPVILLQGDGVSARLEKPERITLQVQGPADQVHALTVDAIRATVDVGDIPGGQTRQRKVTITGLPPGVRLVKDPPLVTISTVPLDQKDINVSIAFITTPPPGTTVNDYRITPEKVMVMGPTEAMNRMKYVSVRIDPSAEFSAPAPVVPLPIDAKGERITGLRVLPEQVNVAMVPSQHATGTRMVAVRPPVLQNPPSGYTITIVKLHPDTVTISGEAALLDRLNGYIESEPIDVSQVTRDATRRVRLRIQRGITLLPGQDIQVTLHAVPIAPAEG